jgi:hypothetical protein
MSSDIRYRFRSGLMPNTIPGADRKLFGFTPESLLDFPPECCSHSARNRVRFHPGIVFGLVRNPHNDGHLKTGQKGGESGH